MARALSEFVLAALLACFVLAGASCREQPGGGTRGLTVVATTGMVADAVRAVGGDRVRVVGLMGEGVDPHLYKPTPGDIRHLSGADMIFYNGLLLEGRMVDVLVKMAGQRPTIAVTEGIDPALLHDPPEFGGHYDPHVWFDVSLWMGAVEHVKAALIKHDPEGAAVYERRAAAHLAELRELHRWCGQQIARIPAEARLLVTAHDAFGYFGRAYGIEVMAIQGVSTDSEASVQQINELVSVIVSRRVPAVFIESSVPPKTIEALVEGCRARGHTVRIGGELFSDAMGAEGTPEGTYTGMVRHNVSTIVRSLMTEGPG